MGWDERFVALAKFMGGWSKDRSRKTGAVIVGPGNEVRSLGFNGFPRKVNDSVDARHERPTKYKWTEHAERNAIYNAARSGTSTLDCRMYSDWYPCMDCARAIIQAGISKLICKEPDWNDPIWAKDFAEVPTMLEEGGVQVVFVK
jgi:dCMP deaminase